MALLFCTNCGAKQEYPDSVTETCWHYIVCPSCRAGRMVANNREARSHRATLQSKWREEVRKKGRYRGWLEA